MAIFSPDIKRALIVDGSELLRGVSSGQLREAGVTEVVAVSHTNEARLRLEREHFDLVMCSAEFGGREESGQDLLDELRREHLLQPHTVFIMVSDAATYQQVADAGDASIDTFLVRPYTTASLLERLHDARKRRKTLSAIFAALHAGEPGQAFVHALTRFQSGQSFGMFCGRLAAEMLLRFQRPEDAGQIFERILERFPNGWAQLGVARSLSAQGDLPGARTLLHNVLQRDPRHADAHELLGQIHLEHGDLASALASYSAASELTPGCLTRAQATGTLAFILGESEQAQDLLTRSSRIGQKSRLFNPMCWVLIGLLQWDQKDHSSLNMTRLALQRSLQRQPDAPESSTRHKVMRRVLEAAHALVMGREQAAIDEAAALSQLADDDGFDIDCATLMLALWARLPEGTLPGASRLSVAQSMGMRLGVSKAASELMSAAAGAQEEVAGALRRTQANINQIAQHSVKRAMGDQLADTVEQLLSQAETTRNARLFELAGLTLRRHAARMTDPQQMADFTARAAKGLQQHALSVSRMAGVQRVGRSPGGIVLRHWNESASLKSVLPPLSSLKLPALATPPARPEPAAPRMSEALAPAAR